MKGAVMATKRRKKNDDVTWDDLERFKRQNLEQSRQVQSYMGNAGGSQNDVTMSKRRNFTAQRRASLPGADRTQRPVGVQSRLSQAAGREPSIRQDVIARMVQDRSTGPSGGGEPVRRKAKPIRRPRGGQGSMMVR